MSAPVSLDGMTMAERILTTARKAPVSVTALAEIHYAGVTPPKLALNVVRTTCAKLRKQGIQVELVDGVVSLGARTPARAVEPWPRFGGEPLSPRERELLRVLQDYRGVPLTSLDIADEMSATAQGRPYKRANVYQKVRRLAAKGIAIEKVGRGYRLADRRRSSSPLSTEA